MSAPRPLRNDAAQTAWISHGFEEIVASRGREPGANTVDCDVVIVGSGYGGAIAGALLAGVKKDEGKGDKVSVWVLERGKEYLPGMFPPRLADLAGHVRFSTEGETCPRGEREGLFDVRIGSDVGAVVANGLGGGSLINAGVMAEPTDDVFQREDWPAVIRKELPDERKKRFELVRRLLGASVPKDDDYVENTVGLNPDRIPAKHKVLKRMASSKASTPPKFFETAITVALTDQRRSSAGVVLNECKRCGDCATGCNHGAKDSLDVNLLRMAEQAGAKIYTGATVLRLRRWRIGDRTQPRDAIAAQSFATTSSSESDAWVLDVVHTDADLRARQGGPFQLVARKVILAAGTFGSTEILLRSRSDELSFSPLLGQRFSSNGDMIAVAYNQHSDQATPDVEVNAIADERVPPDKREVGPTITGAIDLRASNETKVVIEELAVPGPLRRVFEEVVTTGHILRELARRDGSEHGLDGQQQDPCAVDGKAIRSSSILAIMGDDGAGGAIELVGGDAETDGDGAVRVRWPEARDHRIFSKGIEALARLGVDSGIKGEVQANPVWQLLPDDFKFLFDNKRGPLLTVHPLGGCPMGEAARDVPDPDEPAPPKPPPPKVLGVVNHLGQVFNDARQPDEGPEFENLCVLDGSIIPTSLGINPSLTIAAFAYRAVERLREAWGWSAPSCEMPAPPSGRPVFQECPTIEDPAPTQVEIVERMSGDALLPGRDGGEEAVRIELTLYFKSVPLGPMFLPGRDGHGKPTNVDMKRTLHVDPARSRLRVFRWKDWHRWRRKAGKDDKLDNKCQWSAPVEGSLTFLHREKSTYLQRRCRALRAWFPNRGARDIWQGVKQYVWNLRHGVRQPPLAPDDNSPCTMLPFGGNACRRLRQRVLELFALASHGGEVRRLEYKLEVQAGKSTTVHPPVIDVHIFDGRPGKPGKAPKIHGCKRLTYGRKSNPWRQLSQMTLDVFPGLPADTRPVLDLDLTYLTQQGVPLMKIVQHEDEPSVIADLGALMGYFLRLLMTVHIWSFRKPDPANPGEPQRLPGVLEGLPLPEITEFTVAYQKDGRPVCARLTRYARPTSTKPPLLMIPGYSASGTTYAHPTLDPHAAGFFWDRGRDIWILDMRTSCGMPTARLPWTFEEVALADIPKAIDYIWHATADQREKLDGKENGIDVFAHCMGSVMFSMAMLAPPEEGDSYFRERQALPERVNRIVLSQIGPVVVFTPDNVFRAYLMSYLRAFLPLADYEFRVGPSPSVTDQLIDRALASMPYPEPEFGIENPWWPPCTTTPWVGSRHRMDALYGRDFNVENVAPEVLNAIDDLFGPLSTDTVSQAIHFARLGVITNRAGRNVFVTRENLLERWKEEDDPSGEQSKRKNKEKRGHPTLSIHGTENGLYDVATLARMKDLFKKDLKMDFTTHEFRGMGHQDCLIGKRAGEVFAVVESFLNRKRTR
jgi:pimeloyl-ACP methyl ester carboxylesterase